MEIEEKYQAAIQAGEIAYNDSEGNLEHALHEALKHYTRPTPPHSGSVGDNDTPTTWTAYRWDADDGDIEYHAHGPKDSFVVFEGVNAKQDCEIFMKAVGGQIE